MLAAKQLGHETVAAYLPSSFRSGPVWTAQAPLKLQLVSKRNQDGWPPDALPIDIRRAAQNETA